MHIAIRVLLIGKERGGQPCNERENKYQIPTFIQHTPDLVRTQTLHSQHISQHNQEPNADDERDEKDRNARTCLDSINGTTGKDINRSKKRQGKLEAGLRVERRVYGEGWELNGRMDECTCYKGM